MYKKPLVDDLKNKFCQEYATTEITLTALSKKYDLAPETIRKQLRIRNIKIRKPSRYNKFRKENGAKMKELLLKQDMTFSKIARIIGCSCSTIALEAKKLGIPTLPKYMFSRKYTINDNFFDAPENWGWEQAYWLGWILSDGYIGYKKNKISFGLQKRDQEVLENLKLMIGYTGPLRFGEGKWQQFHDGYYKNQDQCILTITNEVLVAKLISYMNLHHKSFNLVYPKFLKEELFGPMMLGFWEGDGTLSFLKDSSQHLCLQIVTTKKMSDELVDKCAKMGIRSASYPKIKDKDIMNFKIKGTLSTLRFLNLIFKNAKFVLMRKYLKYKSLVELLIFQGEKKKYRICEKEDIRIELIKSQEIIKDIDSRLTSI